MSEWFIKFCVLIHSNKKFNFNYENAIKPEPHSQLLSKKRFHFLSKFSEHLINNQTQTFFYSICTSVFLQFLKFKCWMWIWDDFISISQTFEIQAEKNEIKRSWRHKANKIECIKRSKRSPKQYAQVIAPNEWTTLRQIKY